jgi:hypothetical protein
MRDMADNDEPDRQCEQSAVANGRPRLGTVLVCAILFSGGTAISLIVGWIVYVLGQ